MTSGAVKCWGANYTGQLGNDQLFFGSNVPVDVSGLSQGVAAVTLGNETAPKLSSAFVRRFRGSVVWR